MKDLIIAKRYAVAAVSNIKEDMYPDFLKETRTLLSILESNVKIYDILKSKIVTTSAKIDLLESLIKDFTLNEFWHSFFLLLTSKKRDVILTLILSEIINQILIQGQALEIDLILAQEHDTETINLIIKHLETKLANKIVYNLIIKKEIIGGFIAKSDDFIIDASMQGKLNQFVKQSITV